MKLSAEKIILYMGACILLLLGVIAWLLFRPAPMPGITTVTTIDTQWVPIHDTVYLPGEPQIVHEEAKPIPPAHQPSANCDSLRGQYNYLSQNYFKQRVYTRTISKDSIRITLTDTVEQNRLQGTMAVWDIKYPQITIKETTTIIPPPRGQLYVITGIGATFKGTGWQGRAGLLHKSKGDKLTGISLWGNNQLQYGAEVQAGWPLFKR